MVNVNSQLLVDSIHTGMVSDVNAILVSLITTINASLLPLPHQSALKMLTSMESHVFVMINFMKFQDSTVKDALMDKFGTDQDATLTQHVHRDMFTTPKRINAIQKP
jgi:hypothetical protein